MICIVTSHEKKFIHKICHAFVNKHTKFQVIPTCKQKVTAKFVSVAIFMGKPFPKKKTPNFSARYCMYSFHMKVSMQQSHLYAMGVDLRIVGKVCISACFVIPQRVTMDGK